MQESWMSPEDVIDLIVEQAMDFFEEAEEVVIAARKRNVDREALTSRFFCCEEHKATLGPLFAMLWPPEES